MSINTPQRSVASSTQFLRLNHLKERLGVSGSSIWAWVKAGKFPKPVKLSENTTAWNAADVEAWSQSRISANQGRGDQK